MTLQSYTLFLHTRVIYYPFLMPLLSSPRFWTITAPLLDDFDTSEVLLDKPG